MHEHGVRTLYLETARYDSTTDVVDPARTGAWLDAAHAAGIRVVGWYIAGYGDHLATDVRRTVAVRNFVSEGGNRFDALDIDIEVKSESATLAAFDRAVASHLRQVRAGVGRDYPVGAIVPAPLGMAIHPEQWTGFPWTAIGRYADVVLPMSYWSYRTDCSSVPQHCPYDYTAGNTRLSARRTGLPVHVIGGLAGNVAVAAVHDFVRAANACHVLGASLYDYATTPSTFWPELADVR
jgi:hypothetical protein